MKKVDKLPLITEININNFHDITLEILKKYNFSNESDITKLADVYSDKYIEIYNYLVRKYYLEKTPEEKDSYYPRHKGRAGIF